MNRTTQMMKRHIKTPLKYALPLLFIGALVLVSISGCTSPSSTSPSPTKQQATATPARLCGQLKTHKLKAKSLETSEGYEGLLNLYDS